MSCGAMGVRETISRGSTHPPFTLMYLEAERCKMGVSCEEEGEEREDMVGCTCMLEVTCTCM